MPESDLSTVFERHESAVRSYCRSFPAVFERAQGAYLWDRDGTRYTDLLCGAGALNYGHNPPEMVARVVAYLTGGGPVQSLDLYTTAKADFLARFHEVVLAPRGMADHVLQFPGPAGTLAVEAALKLARKITGRSNVISFAHGFHGVSLGSLATTANPLLRGAAGVPLRDVTVLPYDDSAFALAEQAEPPAAFILETVQGEGGLNVAGRAWLASLRRLADSVGALVIVDDIQAGCGRTGTFFSFDGYPELRPDLVCLSKSLSGMGLPMAALLIRREYDRWAPGEHNGTFRGHNLAFVAGNAALDLWAGNEFPAHALTMAEDIRASLAGVVAALPAGTAEVAGRGAMSGLRFTSTALVEHIRSNLFHANVIAESSGDGQVLKFLPPLTMSRSEWSTVADTIGSVVTDVATLDVAV